ncbi:cytochrome P450 [Didymella exigua CBS 183.55]|uniref:Cytochrome P450 n=1 Tax=Didymella exigua CBS 183.55 TaxID=1150837 RepID=A0A6A5S3I4_9PLEO|nr:cytochrome P450 [Didymella exigua CBS 183.55]KAF1934180.1 cytochrome P450 [Didymella exigua CBS 183.55]
MDLLHNHTLASALVSICLLWVLGCLTSFCKDRKRYQKLPGPPCSLMFGHLISVGKVAMMLPRRAHPQTLVAQAIRDYELPPIFYVDSRPLSIVSLVVTDPDVARHVAEPDLPKHPAVVEFVESFIGKVNMLTTNSPLVPMFVDCCREFLRLLDEHSDADRVFRVEEEATKITVDVIGKAICGHDFKCLTSGSQFVSWIRAALSWARELQLVNPFHHCNVLRPIVTKYYRFRMSRYIGKILDDRFAAGQSVSPVARKTKTGIDLALELYVGENSGQSGASATAINAESRQATIDNLGLLLFAGHDTTASTLCYCYKSLSDNPHALAVARKELDDVFGVDVSAADQLRHNPFLVIKFDHMLAVIKEVLRLWTSASSARAGRKDFFVREPVSGELLPTEGVNVWIHSFSMGPSKMIWSEDIDQFKPERFLPGNVANIPADAWRPFEKGPRACIGQEFTYLEIKALASLQAFGDSMYQVLLATAKPREGMPARVERRRAF